ncbi:MAG: NAD-dependent epimerase/dehydratase family protein [Bacteroidales bacterium]|nr:NAD-dependent epimerase/dehydratase family protein [Bacteroidales bacterium]MCF8389611.1 NAD-dependent epimerase/dehydratase family protein [Bacteroidales bacterium]
MNVFVSGATGFIGSKLALALAEKGIIVHALYRSDEKAKSIQHKNIKLFKGDILNLNSLRSAIENCEQVYHVAAFARAWTKNPDDIYSLNIDGALNVLNVSSEAGVKRVVLTSTAGVLGASKEGVINETSLPDEAFSHYEKSKSIIEKKIRDESFGDTEIVIVSPSRVYGPGLLSESNSVTSLINKFMLGSWRFIPGNGESIANYVFIDDVIRGHILAMEKGRDREKYILGGENISYNKLFEILEEIRGKRTRLYKIPLFIMLFISHVFMLLSFFGISPMITPALVKKYNKNFRLDITKAQNELAYKPIEFKEGALLTCQWGNWI